MTMTLCDALALADQDCPLPKKAGEALKVLRDAYAATLRQQAVGADEDGARFRFIVEHNWIGAKTRCERHIQDSDLGSARRAVDEAIAAAPSAPEGDGGEW